MTSYDSLVDEVYEYVKGELTVGFTYREFERAVDENTYNVVENLPAVELMEAALTGGQMYLSSARFEGWSDERSIFDNIKRRLEGNIYDDVTALQKKLQNYYDNELNKIAVQKCYVHDEDYCFGEISTCDSCGGECCDGHSFLEGTYPYKTTCKGCYDAGQEAKGEGLL